MVWLCQCGNGSIGADDEPPEVCGLCGFPLGEYFGQWCATAPCEDCGYPDE